MAKSGGSIIGRLVIICIAVVLLLIGGSFFEGSELQRHFDLKLPSADDSTSSVVEEFFGNGGIERGMLKRGDDSKSINHGPSAQKERGTKIKEQRSETTDTLTRGDRKELDQLIEGLNP